MFPGGLAALTGNPFLCYWSGLRFVVCVHVVRAPDAPQLRLGGGGNCRGGGHENLSEGGGPIEVGRNAVVRRQSCALQTPDILSQTRRHSPSGREQAEGVEARDTET